MLKHKLKNPTTGNLNQVSTLLSKKKSDRKAYDVAKSWLGDQGVSDDDIEKQSEEGDVGEVSMSNTIDRGGDSEVKNLALKYGFQEVEGVFKPAPGNAGSLLNEIVSGEVAQMVEENPNISEEEQEIQKFCKETWTDRFKEGYKRWRESVGPWVE